MKDEGSRAGSDITLVSFRNGAEGTRDSGSVGAGG